MTDPQTVEAPRVSPSSTQDEGIDILDILLILAHDRRRIAIVTLVFFLLGGTVSFLLKPTFTATAMLLPPRRQQSAASALLGQIGSLAGLARSDAGGLLKNPADIYVAMLTSRTATDQVIDRFHLKSVYKTKTMYDTRKAFKSHVTVQATKDGLIEIDAKDHDPNRASDIANGLVDALHHLTSTLAISEAAQRRLFFYEQIQSEKAALAKADDALRKTQEKTGLIQLSDQAAAIIGNIANLRAQIISLEVELQAERTYATDENPEVMRLQQQIQSLQGQLAKMENNQNQMKPGSIQVPTVQIPKASLEYATRLREVTFHTTLLTLLSKEYEAARIDEAKSAPLIQVVDRAIPPDKKSGPHRLLITLGCGILGFCAGCIWTFTSKSLSRIKETPERAAKLHQLYSSLRWRRQ